MNLREMMAALAAPIPSNLIQTKSTFQKKRPSGTADYVAWYHYCDLLDARIGAENWEWEVVSNKQVGDSLVIVGRLTIHGSDRSLSRDATGIEEINCSSYGDPSSNSEAMALRRACSKLGLGRELWDKSAPKAAQGRPMTQTPQTPQTRQPTPTARRNGEITREEWLARHAAALGN